MKLIVSLVFFLGNIKANEICIYLPSDEILLNKFNVMNWDVVTDNLIHIKFLIKYSPTLSKLIDNDELDFKMVEMPSDGQQPTTLKGRSLRSNP